MGGTVYGHGAGRDQLPAQLGQTISAGSVSVVMASDAVSPPVPPVGGRAASQVFRKDYTAGSVTTASYVQIIASTAAAINKLWVFDSSGSAMILAVGGAGVEVPQIYIAPGGTDGGIDLLIPVGSRVSLKALDVTASTGQFLITGLS